jgi:hypothetical protein
MIKNKEERSILLLWTFAAITMAHGPYTLVVYGLALVMT